MNYGLLFLSGQSPFEMLLRRSSTILQHVIIIFSLVALPSLTSMNLFCSASSTTTFPPISSSVSVLGCYKRHFSNIVVQRRQQRTLEILLHECRGGSDYPPGSRGVGRGSATTDPSFNRPPYYDSELKEGGNYDYGDDRQPGYGYDPYYSEEQEQQRRQRRRSDVESDGDPYGTPPYSRRQRWSDDNSNGSRRAEKNAGVSLLMDAGNRKIGILLASSGAVFTLLGISLFFNKTLLRMGNLLFISGVPLILGPSRTAGYFFQPTKARATGCLILGIFFVLAGRPILGMALEIFGIMNLFGNLFPLLMVMLRQVPFLGDLLPSGNNGGGKRRRPTRERREYYEDRPYYEDDRSSQDGVEQYY
jgi:hypothetical protein